MMGKADLESPGSLDGHKGEKFFAPPSTSDQESLDPPQ